MLVFCTTGVLLRKLQSDPLLSDITHIILDEVHERDLVRFINHQSNTKNTDLLLSIIKNILPKRPDLRLVLMSATADTLLFQTYFKSFGAGRTLPPIINVFGKCFNVEENYLESVEKKLKANNLLPSTLTPFFKPNFSPKSYEERNMYIRVMKSTIDYISKNRPKGAILVFLSGWAEISLLKSELLKDVTHIGYNNLSAFKICSMHSSVPLQDQKEAFHIYDSGVRKIILATNIAETSITVSLYFHCVLLDRSRMLSM